MRRFFKINPIGKVKVENGQSAIHIDKPYISALLNMDGFSHLQIVWWGHLMDKPKNRSVLIIDRLFKKSPEKLGIFATHAPARPNPILISTIKVSSIDYKNGIIFKRGMDAENDSPVLDIKPYYLMERVKDCRVPAWCSHWPKWYEEISTFNWKSEMTINQ